jgi:hypothetical protein
MPTEWAYIAGKFEDRAGQLLLAPAVGLDSMPASFLVMRKRKTGMRESAVQPARSVIRSHDHKVVVGHDRGAPAILGQAWPSGKI